ncbi:hypothetical protein B296_00029265 [Ensete ventricosum]|uniref:Uncharacterized protein n=1 Tax=Ensete ventricosum TaxID=4639 RepID=A0A427A281_ENSVE|nr:hypothetical protein B296_00029265 [Ensete ventricosum]
MFPLRQAPVTSTRDVEALRTELQSIGAKAITEYKMSRGFELDMERIGRVTYEFGYRVALKLFKAKYPNLFVKEDRFANYPEDSNVQMEGSQPFNDSIPFETELLL